MFFRNVEKLFGLEILVRHVNGVKVRGNGVVYLGLAWGFLLLAGGGIEARVAVVSVGLEVAQALIDLPVHFDESGVQVQLFQGTNSEVGASRTDTSQNVKKSGLNGASVGQLHGFALAGAVLSHSTGVLLHCCGTAHAVELLVLLAVDGDEFTATFIVTREHASQHDEIRAST